MLKRSARPRLRHEHRLRGRRFDVAVFGMFGIGNYGNDATLDATLQTLSRVGIPNDAILCVVPLESSAVARYGLDCAPIWRQHTDPPRAQMEAAEIDAPDRSRGREPLRRYPVAPRSPTVLIAGTGVLDDQHTTWEPPLDILRWSVARRLAGARLHFLAVGAGPITRRASRALLRSAVGLAHHVSYRDIESLEFMASIGRNTSSDDVVPN